jgi:hypothetical protein
MIKNKFIIIFFIFLSNSLHANLKIELKNLEIEKVHYQQNPWDFVDNLLITYPSKEFSTLELIPKLIAFTPYIAALTYVLYPMIKGDRIKEEEAGALAFIGIIVVPFIYLGYKGINSLIHNTIIKNKIIKVLKWFFENYNKDAQNNSNINLRDFIPTELQKTFDDMFDQYNKNGVPYLKTNLINIALKIREQIIYEIKKEKYNKYIIMESGYQSSLTSIYYTLWWDFIKNIFTKSPVI